MTRENALAELLKMKALGCVAAYGMPDGQVLYSERAPRDYQPVGWEWAAVLRDYDLKDMPVGWLQEARTKRPIELEP